MSVPVQVRSEEDALLGDLAQTAQAEDLIAAGVRQDGPWPPHKLMQPSQALDQLRPGPQIQVIGICQQDAKVELLDQIPGRQAFHAALRAHRHEHRRLDHSVRRMKQPGACARLGAFRHDFEAHSSQSTIVESEPRLKRRS